MSRELYGAYPPLSLTANMPQINDFFGAAKKNMLNNANKLLQDMQEYDKDNISDKVISVSRIL